MKKAAEISRESVDPKGSKCVLIVAGEASADVHGGNLVSALRKLEPHVRCCGIGGDRMREAGVELLFHASEMAVVGLTEVLRKAWTIGRAMRTLKRILREGRPDLVILIDYPGFNLRMAGHAKAFGVPVLYYISPQIWAWRRDRIRKIRDRVDRMAVILPFEEAFYLKQGVRVDYVGHPLMDGPASRFEKRAERWVTAARRDGPVLGLLPGSRREEIRRLLPAMIRAVAILKTRYPRIRCLLPLAPTIERRLVEEIIQGSAADVSVAQDTYKVLAACDAAIVTSGTATLETAALEVPMVIVYRVSRATYWIAKRVVQVPRIGLVNLVAGEGLVPELIQDEVTPERMALETEKLLEDSVTRERVIQGLKRVRGLLGGGGASERTARIAVEMMGGGDGIRHRPQDPFNAGPGSEG